MARRRIGDCRIDNHTCARQFLYCIQGQLTDEHATRPLHRNTDVFFIILVQYFLNQIVMKDIYSQLYPAM